jgi:hypothetical protein
LQVSGDGGASDEFVELYNSGAEAVALNGWSLQYKSAASSFPLAAKKNLPDVTMPANGYFLAAHAGYNGAVASDLAHSSFSFSGAASGGTVFLSKSTAPLEGFSDPNLVDFLSYGQTDASDPNTAGLPEPESAIFRIAHNHDANDYEILPAAPRNLTYEPEPPTVPQEESPHDNPTQEDPPSDDPPPEDTSAGTSDGTPQDQQEPAENPNQEPNDTTDQNQDQEPENNQGSPADGEDPGPEYPDGIVISELLPNPDGTDAGREFVELHNQTQAEVNLRDWILDDNGSLQPGSSAYQLPDLTVPAGGYLAVYIPAGKFALNNSSADSARLYWPDGNLLNEVNYSGPVQDNESWCLIDGGYEWCLPTPSSANQSLPEETEHEDEEEEEHEEDTEDTVDYSDFKIVIIEIVPDPLGADAGFESVKLLNQGSEEVDLKGWILDDGLGDEPIGKSAYSLLTRKLEPGDETEITIPKGKFALNNSSADGLRLYSPDKKIKDKVEYDKAEPGTPYLKGALGWAWFTDPEQEGESEGEVGQGQVASAALPRSGLPLAELLFVFWPAIWYAVTSIKKQYEQTRTDRCVGS